jgi:hypothetical protein
MTDALGSLLDTLGRDQDERIAICHKPPAGTFTVELTTVEKAPTVAANYADWDCWYSSQPLNERVTAGRGLERDVIGCRELHADLDVKSGGMPDYDAAKTVISVLSAMLLSDPVAVVESGHGLQPHWRVERDDSADWADENHPHWADGRALLRRWGRLVAKVAKAHAGNVDNVYDLSRVLRVPGTINLKAEPRPVTISFCGGTPVSLEELRDTLEEQGIRELPEDRERLGDVKVPSADWTFGQITCPYVAGMVDGWSDDTPKARHPWLTAQATRLAAAHRADCITEADYAAAIQRLANRFLVLLHTGDKRGPHPNEISDALAWGVARVETKTDEAVRRELGDHLHHPGETTTLTVDGFWDARPELTHIRDLARARMASPWAVLGVVLARVIAAVEPRWQLPKLVGTWMSLNFFVGLVGPSGDGKDSSIGAARDAVNVGDVAELTPGSGEGIAHSYVRRSEDKKEIVQHTKAVLFVAREVEALTQLRNRQGSTLLSELRIAFTGAPLGFAYVDPAKRLVVGAHTYRLCLIVGIQPELARPLVDEAGAGTPQRFLWMPTNDPGAPGPDDLPTEPEPLDWKAPTWSSGDFADPVGRRVIGVCDTAVRLIRQTRTDQLHRKVHALDGHALLTRLKVATGLALLNRRTDVDDTDWQLAGQVMAVSNATRQKVVDTLTEQRTAANRARGRDDAERAVVAEDHTAEHHIQRVARWIMKRLTGHGDWITHRELRGDLPGRDRQWFDEAVTRLVAAGQVEVCEGTYHGQPTRRYRVVS